MKNVKAVPLSATLSWILNSLILILLVVRMLLVVRPGAPFVASLLLVAMPFAPSSVLAPTVYAN